MKSSSLGARLFEGLVQPILGSLWTSPPATIQDSGDRTNTASGKQTHVQRPVSRDQPKSGCYVEAPAMRSTLQQHRHGSCGKDATRTATAGGISSLRRPQAVPRRSVNSGARLANAANFEIHASSAGTPPAPAERASHKRQKRALQRQAFCRSKEEGQRTTKGANDSLAARSIITSGHGRTGGNNSGPGNGASTVRIGLRSYKKTCNSGKDCSSSSSSWGGDDCVLPSADSNLLLSGSVKHMAAQRSGQAWSIIRAQPEDEPPEKQLQRPSKQHSGQVQREDGAVRYAICSEESSSEAELHSCKSAVPACVTVGNSCAAGPSSCRLQCSDTTTTCSGSSMTNCGDSRDTATGSAAMAPEHQQQYLDIEEQMPLTFPASPAEDPPRTVCSTRAAFPYAQNSGSVSCPSSLECVSAASSAFPRLDATVQTSSHPPAPMTLASSISVSGESVQHGSKACGLTSHASLPHHTQQDQEAAASAGDASNISRVVHYALIPSSSRRQQQQLHLQNSAASAAAAAAAASKDSTVNISVAAGHQEDCSKALATTEACAADNEIHHEQEDQHQQRRAEGVTPGSVVFGHRVLKPLRSKCLEENYDALVEIVAFTKRRCERETMELLRKDAHILYYARGLHHAAHVETYLRQKHQSQQEKQQQGSANVPHNDSTTATCSAASLNVSSTRPVPHAASENAPPAASSTTEVPSADKRNHPAAPCFPSVSAALAGGARPQAVPDWATPEALRDALERQQCYDPFSIFGEAPPELLLSEVYDEQHYTHISPQTRASHPVLARLKHQRSAALMAVFQQKSAGLFRTQQLLEHELRQLQRQQRTNSSPPQQVALEHGSLSSVLGQALFSRSSGTAAATIKADVGGEDGGGLSSLPLKKVESEGNPEARSNKDKEAMLRLQHREVLVQRQLLERRLEEQLQQEERIHGELLRNGFRFLGGRVNGAEKGAVLFRKWVLPALESWWQQQCQVELDWRNDPLTSEECSWYREVMNAAVDASDLISVQQACFCPTPPPYRQWAWTDCRVRQRQQHEQKLAKLREQQVQQQQEQLTREREGSPAAVDWISGESAEYNEAEEAGDVDICAVSEDESPGAADSDEFPSLQQQAAADGPHAGEGSCAHSSVAASAARKPNEQRLSGRTASRRGRKRRAKGDGTPQGYGSNVEAPGSDRESAAASNSGSARKRPRSFCRQVRNIHFQQAQTERSQKLRIALESSSGQCACGSRLLRKENVAKHHPTSGTKRGTLVSASGSPAAPEAEKSCHRTTGGVRPAGGSAAPHWQQPLNEHTNSEENTGSAVASAGTCIPAAGGNGKDVVSPCRGRQADPTFSTPVAKMQALKLSKQQRCISTGPSPQLLLRERAVDRGQQQHTRPAAFAPSNKTAGVHRGASPGDPAVVSPSPAAATMKTPAYHIISSWRGSGGAFAAGRLEWDRKAATAEAAGTSAAAGGSAGCCGSGVGDGYSNVAAREAASEAGFSTSAEEARCPAAKSLKQLKTSAAQRRPRQLQRQGIRSSRAVQESCLSACKPGLGVQVTPGAGTHSRVAAAAVREVSAGKAALAEPTSSGFLRKGTRSGDNSTSKNLYLQPGGNVRAPTLQAVRGARLSIDRVYGCRRTRTICAAEPLPDFF